LDPPSRPLTDTEKRVLGLLVEGADGRTIASKLRISPNEVGKHVQSILTKLNVHSRLEAAAYAVRGAPRPIRVLIVDDHELFAEAIRSALLDADIDVAAVLSSGEDAVTYLEDDHPDVVLLDVGLPDRSGLAVGREILEGWPEARLVVLTALDDPMAVNEAMATGFRGYLMKDTPLSNLVGSLEAVVSGQAVFPHRSNEPSGRQPDPLDELTELEWRTVGLLAEGADEARMTSTLGLPPEEVGPHVARLLDELGVPERVDEALRRIGSDPVR
jgi:DNA-binding NarL/FixJ family response regulator